MALINQGDEVIILPFWVSYKEIVKVAEAKTVYVKTTLANNFKVTLTIGSCHYSENQINHV